MIIRIKIIHAHNVTESNPYKCEKNLLFKYEKIETGTSPFLDETMKHVIGNTEGGSQEDCMDLCNGAERCQSFFYLEKSSGIYKARSCYLSSIDLSSAERPPGEWKSFAKSCVDGMFIYI